MRAWISAEIDGELSEFESALVRDHLGQCDSCTMFRADAARFAVALRSAELEPLSRPVTVPHPRRFAQPLRVPAVAALAVAMIGLGGLFASLHSSAIQVKPSQPSVAALDDQGFRALQLQGTKAAFAELRLRRAEVESARIPRHTGFQNP
jgi:hypothetical protein